jgi:hypothetical protein
MGLLSAAEGEWRDAELGRVGRLVRFLGVCAGGARARLSGVGRHCAAPLRDEDGLALAVDMLAEALPAPLRETAYALACDVAAADGVLADEELNLWRMMRHELSIDRLVAAAIERATYARHAVL